MDKIKAVTIVFIWSYGLNRTSLDWLLVPGKGFEPSTVALQMRCSTN